MPDNIEFATFIRVGTVSNVSYQIDNSAGGFVAVTFDTPFPAGVIPKVIATGSLGNGRVGDVSVSAITNTGFSLLARTMGNTGTTGEVQYIAIAV